MCPGEVAVFECATDKTSLLWTLPQPIGTISYVRGDLIEVFTVRGPATVWLLNSTNLTSRLVLSYAPDLNNTLIRCGTNETKYYISGMVY